MMARTIFSILFLILTTAGAAPAGSIEVQLVTGEARSGASLVLTDGKLQLKGEDGAAVGDWPLLDVDTVSVAGKAVAPAEQPKTGQPAERCGAVLIGGKLLGKVRAIDLQGVTIESPALGNIKLPLSAVRAVQLAGAADMAVGERDGDGDILVLSNGDRVPGTINTLSDEKIAFSSELGEMELERSRVMGLLLMAPPGGRAALKSMGLRAVLADGSSLLLVSPSSEGEALKGQLLGGSDISIPLAQVARLEVVGGRLIPLDSLEIIEYEQHSVDLLTWQVVRGKNVLGETMRLTVADRDETVAFNSGLGVHGPCRLVFQLDGNYERLLCLVGVDESAGEYADVNVAIRLDGKEAFRADKVKWREAARQVRLNLEGVKKMELIVEAGEYFDVQDRVNWADCRLLKSAASR